MSNRVDYPGRTSCGCPYLNQPDAAKHWRECNYRLNTERDARQTKSAPAQDEQQPVPDAVWEALQRMIESTSLMGPHSREDALLVSRYRDRYRLLADPIVQIEQPPVAVPVGFALVPARLKAENGAKGALSGEFSIQHETTCSACYFDEADDDCEVCGGKTQYVERITVPWETIKEIYAAAVTAVAAPIAPPAPQPEQSGLVAVLELIKKDTRSDDPLDHYEIVCRALSQYRAALAAHRAGGEA